MSQQAQPHGRLTEVFDGVFMITGRFRIGPGIAIPRNMTAVRHGKGIVLLNGIRLTSAGEDELAKLGPVEHVVRLGGHHGSDDGYLAGRFQVPIWGPPGVQHAAGISNTKELSAENHPLPDGAQVFVFTHGKRPEAATLLPMAGGVLVTCDSYQNWESYAGCTPIAKLILRLNKFGPTMIGPMWLKSMGPDIVEDLLRLRDVPFRHLISGHGALLKDTAREGFDIALRTAGLLTR
jgi:hypothetical protein